MISVRFLTVHARWPWLRQFPNGHPRWGRCHFMLKDQGRPYDYLVVFDGNDVLEPVRCPRTNTIFVASEPVNVKRYREAFLAQFATVITTDRETPHPNRIFQHAGLPWHI